jgi:hypothetical protein
VFVEDFAADGQANGRVAVDKTPIIGLPFVKKNNQTSGLEVP